MVHLRMINQNTLTETTNSSQKLITIEIVVSNQDFRAYQMWIGKRFRNQSQVLILQWTV